MIYNFDQVIDRRSSDSVKWNHFDPDILPMWVADMDFISPEPVVQALEERVRQGVFGYAKELPRLKESIVGWLSDRFNWVVQPKDILPLTGVVVGFNLVSQALAGANQSVLIQPPVYMPFLTVGKNMEGQVQEAPLVQDTNGRYGVDFNAFEAAIDQRTRMFLLCSPHNPVGRVWERMELERMAEICLRHGMTICSDDIHADLVYQPNHHIPIASLNTDIAARTVTLLAPSKTFNVPGLNFSFAVVQNEDLRKKMMTARRGIVGEPNLLGYVAAQAAYTSGAEWLEQVLSYLQSNRDFMVAWLRQELPALKIYPVEGTYLAWIDCRNAGIEGPAAEFFKKYGRVGFNDGSAFGHGGSGFVRLNFACPRSTLVKGLERMRRAFEVAKLG